MKAARLAVGTLPETDVTRLRTLVTRMEAASVVEVIRRNAIFVEAILDLVGSGGEVVLCRRGQPDRVILPV